MSRKKTDYSEIDLFEGLGKDTHVVKALKNQGFYTKALVRHPYKLKQQGKYLDPFIDKYVDEVVIGDVTKPDTLKHICDHVDYVFSSVGMTKKNKGLSFNDVDYQGNVNLLKEAEHSRIHKFMYIHVCTGDSWKKPGPMIDAKNRFVDVLTASNIDHIIIRPTGYFSDMSNFLTMAKRGRAYLIGNGKARMNPIHGEDLASFCIDSFIEVNQTLDVGGPEIFTYEQITKLAFNVLNKEERITHVPPALLQPIAVLLKRFSKQNDGLFRFLMNVMTNDVIAPTYGKHRIREFFKVFK